MISKYEDLCVLQRWTSQLGLSLLHQRNQAKDTDYVKMGDEHGIYTMEYSQLATLISGQKAVTKNVDDWELSNTTPLIKHRRVL